jgi:hypothetical protein
MTCKYVVNIKSCNLLSVGVFLFSKMKETEHNADQDDEYSQLFDKLMIKGD